MFPEILQFLMDLSASSLLFALLSAVTAPALGPQAEQFGEANGRHTVQHSVQSTNSDGLLPAHAAQDAAAAAVAGPAALAQPAAALKHAAEPRPVRF